MNKILKSLKWFLGTTIALLAIGYALIIGYFYANQSHLLFRNIQKNEVPHFQNLNLRDVRIRTRDNETLQAWYLAPKPNQPVFLFLHGNASTLAMGEWRYRRIQSAGAGVLALAYRGYSGSTGAPSEQGLFKDGLAAYDWLIAQGFKAEDIVIHGHSLGTGVATYVATERSARALLLESPFTAASDAASFHYPYIPIQLLMRDKFLNRARIANVKMPIMIAHGDKDSVIPFSQGQQLFRLIKGQKEFVAMHGSEHNTLVRDGVYAHYWKFIKPKPVR